MQDTENETERVLAPVARKAHTGSRSKRHGVTVVFPSRKPKSPACFAGFMAAPGAGQHKIERADRDLCRGLRFRSGKSAYV